MALYPESGYSSGLKLPAGVRIRGSIKPGYETVLTHEAVAFVADLVRTFRPIVHSNLALRALDQAKYDAGGHPGFDFRTKAIREEDWTCAPMPAAIQDRRVEITGPVDRKMVINALNSGAKVFMADFEDSLAPTWSNLVEGHINLRDAVNGNIRYEDPRTKKVYSVTNPNPAKIFVRPRGWHLPEAHFEVDGQAIPGCLMDFGLYFFHNQAAFRSKHGGAGPFFYLPKMQHSREAAVWNAVFERAQDALGVPRGSIKATVLIETLPAVFQMHEILYELRQHSAGLNCGRWDYIFSFIKTFRNHPELVIPDRTQVGMTQHFLSSYAQLLIQTCHRRGVHAMGGMAAQIPVKNDPQANEAASAKVRTDKLREVLAGHDGTWAAHPGLIPLVYQVFDAHMPTPNQLHRLRDDVQVSEADLLAMPVGSRTLEGLRLNLSVGVQYTAAWLTGTGSVPLHNLMEDAATAEISRVQVWQWLRHGAILDGEQAPVRVTRDLVERILREEVAIVERELGPQRFAAGRYQEAAQLFGQQCTAKELDDFLTLEAYKRITEVRPNSRL
ncbi:malate synthase [Klebsormidium nitens]|uniref:Malate synthase n=1 Tax=Klebsormidium nitens TaxID=105231 RepID=A0A1Y1HLZ1_KLENI|nr:malate synthase [Klebsormidium nitens]|eukprot:GAQ78179.1 malate synthase [Klebsormidium nitens]